VRQSPLVLVSVHLVDFAPHGLGGWELFFEGLVKGGRHVLDERLERIFVPGLLGLRCALNLFCEFLQHSFHIRAGGLVGLLNGLSASTAEVDAVMGEHAGGEGLFLRCDLADGRGSSDGEDGPHLGEYFFEEWAPSR
jgi:hypothetical protein